MIRILDKKQDPIGIVIHLNKFTFVLTKGFSLKTTMSYKHNDYTSYFYLGLHLMVNRKNKGKGFRSYLFI